MAKESPVFTDRTTEDLKEQVGGMEQEYQQLKFDHAVKGLGNPLVLRELRRDIARVYTELRRRELAAMTPEQLDMRTKLRARRRRQG